MRKLTKKCMTGRWAVAVLAVVMCVQLVSSASADTFGAGENQLTIEFVTIRGDASSANGTNISDRQPGDTGYGTFTEPGYNYRMGVYEITNDQWDKFRAEWDGLDYYLGDLDTYWHGTNIPTDRINWYEAAQFVNWLNTSKGYQAAYKFTGQGTEDYQSECWDPEDAAEGGINVYRHKDAFYYLPTECEWVKAAYWNGTDLQTYATKAGEDLHQGDGVSGTGWNYVIHDEEGNMVYATDPKGPWDVGSGSEELNGTFDMMGNIAEWTESPKDISGYWSTRAQHIVRGGQYQSTSELPSMKLSSSYRLWISPFREYVGYGFRVASVVPEPATISILSFGVIAILSRRRHRS